MNTQNKRIQELMDIVEQKDDVIVRLQDLISHLEETIKDYVSLRHLNFLHTKKIKSKSVLIMDFTLEN